MEFVQPIRDKEKIAAIKKILQVSSYRDYALFTLGINSGLRISDLLKLKVGDVVDNNRKIKERISLREKKTAKSKDFPISDTARKVLEKYLEKGDLEPDAFLFPSRKKHSALHRQQAWKIMNDAAKAVGITEKIGTHSIRKTFGYHAYQSGTSVSLLQKIFNHAAPNVTLRYIGITQDEIDEVYLNLNL